MCNTLLNDLREWALNNLHPLQFAFIPKSHIGLHNVLISNTIDKWRANPNLKFLIIQNFDFEKAYDLAQRQYILKQLRIRNALSEEKIKVLEWLQNQVVTNLDISGKFEGKIVKDGLVQGDPSACLQWNILIDPLLYRANSENKDVYYVEDNIPNPHIAKEHTYKA